MEAVQQHILKLLETENTIQDTRAITLPGEYKPAKSQDAQLVVQGALNSLLSKEVSIEMGLTSL